MGEAALILVDCSPLRARMTEAACVRRWRAAQGAVPPSHDSLSHCHICPIGALRAGEKASVAVNAAVADACSHVCPRCDRPAARLINGRHCTSCYNRTAEAIRGKNAKGTRPRLADVIHPEALAVGSSIVRIDHVVSRPEALAIAARQAGPGSYIGVPPLVPPAPPGLAVLMALPLPMGPLGAEPKPPARCLIRAPARRGHRVVPMLRPSDRAYAAQPALPL